MAEFHIEDKGIAYDARLLNLLIELCDDKKSYFTTADYRPKRESHKRLGRLITAGILELTNDRYGLGPTIDRATYGNYFRKVQKDQARPKKLYFVLAYKIDDSEKDVVELSYYVSPKPESRQTARSFLIKIGKGDVHLNSLLIAFTVPEEALRLEDRTTHLDLDPSYLSQTNTRRISIIQPGLHEIGINVFVRAKTGYRIRLQSPYKLSIPKPKAPFDARLELALTGSSLSHKLMYNGDKVYPVGEQTATTSFSHLELRDFMQGIKPENTQRLQNLGRRLAERLPLELTKKLQSLIMDTRIRLYLANAEAQSYPWECLWRDGDFIFEDRRITRATPREMTYARHFSMVNPVVFLVNHRGTTHAVPAAEATAQLFGTQPIMDLAEFQKVIKTANLIHIFGHHQTARRSHPEPLFFKTKGGAELRPDDLPELVGKPLVILANCFTNTFFHDNISDSWSNRLLENGAGAVIATHFQVTDEGAKTFAANFYEKFLNGESLGEAFHHARQQFAHQQDRLAYVLYGRYEARYRKENS